MCFRRGKGGMSVFWSSFGTGVIKWLYVVGAWLGPGRPEVAWREPE